MNDEMTQAKVARCGPDATRVDVTSQASEPAFVFSTSWPRPPLLLLLPCIRVVTHMRGGLCYLSPSARPLHHWPTPGGVDDLNMYFPVGREPRFCVGVKPFYSVLNWRAALAQGSSSCGFSPLSPLIGVCGRPATLHGAERVRTGHASSTHTKHNVLSIPLSLSH